MKDKVAIEEVAPANRLNTVTLRNKTYQLAVTVEIKKDQLGEAKDFKGILARLSERYEGEWVAVLDTGDLVSDKDPEAVFAEAKKRKATVTALFQVPKKGELLLR